MKIAVLAGFDLSLVNFRGPLLRAMIEAGHEVIGLAPAQTPDVPDRLRRIGARFIAVELSRTGLNPMADLRYRRDLEAILRREKPDLVLAYTIKAVVHGVVAAHNAGVPRIHALITGLGTAFSTVGLKGRFLRFCATRLYRQAFKHCDRVFVQNQETADFFLAKNCGRPERFVLVAGSGVDLTHYSRCALPVAGKPVFLMLSRLLKDKGVADFVEAARQLKREGVDARFIVAGAAELPPAGIPSDQLETWKVEGTVEFLPHQDDVRPLLKACTAYVLPSFYMEGVPRSLLEALATGRALVTTDSVGCRDTIRGDASDGGKQVAPGVRSRANGLLIPPRQASALAAALRALAVDRGMAERMGQAGRALAEEVFDVNKVNRQMMEAMGL